MRHVAGFNCFSVSMGTIIVPQAEQRVIDITAAR